MSTDRKMAAVRALCAAARDVASRADVVSDVVASTGLSKAGVELALREHLEVAPSDAELRALVAYAGDAPRVGVVLSANVFVGALRAIALARAASERVVVRPSRRDPAFTRALVAAVRDHALTLDESFDVAMFEEGELHIYGHDETIAAVRSRLGPGVRLVGHGSGLGVAWITARADLDAAARSVADDVVVFDQRGCLSPRIVFVEGARADAFADALHRHLDERGRVVPRGLLPADVRTASERYIDTMAYAGRVLIGSDHVVGVAPAGAPLVASPAYRHVHLVSCATAADAASFMAPLRESIVAFGSDDADAAERLAPSWARRAALGRMQKPPFDGPVDWRTSLSG